MSLTTAQYSSDAAPTKQRPSARRIWTTGLLAIVLSAIANLIIRQIAVSIFPISPDFLPLSPGAVVFYTFLFIAIGTGVFHLITRRSQRPAQTFRWVALVALAISLIPNVMLLFADMGPMSVGVSTEAVLTLISMHLVSAAITIGLLTTRGVE